MCQLIILIEPTLKFSYQDSILHIIHTFLKHIFLQFFILESHVTNRGIFSNYMLVCLVLDFFVDFFMTQYSAKENENLT